MNTAHEVHTVRLKGFNYEMVCGLDSQKYASMGLHEVIELFNPMFINIKGFDPDTGAAGIEFMPSMPPYVDPNVKSLHLVRGDILYALKVNADMEREYLSITSGITIPKLVLSSR